MTKEVKVFEHPGIKKLFTLYGKEAEELSLEINSMIAEEFNWAIVCGYKQVYSSAFPNRERTIFVKTHGNYKFYFDVRYLILQMSFVYNQTNSMFRFNGDGEYDECIDFNQKMRIIYSNDMELLENTLISSFKTEIYNFFLKDI